MEMRGSALHRSAKWVRHILGPLLLITLCPPLVMLVWHTNIALDGSVQKLFAQFGQDGVLSTVYSVWAPVFFGTPTAWKILLVFAGAELLLMKFLPGKKIEGLVTPKGNVPIFKANGFLAFLSSLALFYLGAYQFKLFSPTIIYDNFAGLLGALTFFSLLFCLFLYFKGRYRPSSSDAETTGDAVFDYFWGMELYPKIFGWDVKVFTHCRFGLMGWALITLSFAAKQESLYGLSNAMLVTASLQLLYIARFFWWEINYLRSMNIIYDRAGFVICWGCMVWLPAIYSSPTLYLVNHPIHLSKGAALGIFTAGLICIFINYLADRQRQYVRSRNGDCTVWKKKPELIFANYKTEWGEEKQSLLLVSGWWGISRHFHYLPELLGAFFWSVPALFNNYLPYFYLTYLFLLLLDRSYRHEKRCQAKYGKDWEKYCQQVPFRLIPYVY